jgi:hypothetical protein
LPNSARGCRPTACRCGWWFRRTTGSPRHRCCSRPARPVAASTT